MFIYSLPILFNTLNSLSPVEALFIAAGIFVIVWLLAPAPQGYSGNLTSERYLYSCWIGSQPLLTTFWPFFLGLNGVLFTADTLAKNGRFTVSSWDDVYFVLSLPIIWWTVSIWRCSANTQWRICSAGARFMTLAVYFEYALKIHIRIDYPRVFFNCEELLLDYGSCF
ncbi:MAG: hypothetical protein ACU83V_13755 [Gammaproteobacteria bacterium]